MNAHSPLTSPLGSLANEQREANIAALMERAYVQRQEAKWAERECEWRCFGCDSPRDSRVGFCTSCDELTDGWRTDVRGGM